MSQNGGDNVALVKTIYSQFTRGDIDGVLSHFADDVTWETPGYPRIPYAGRFCGRNEAAKFFDGLGKTASIDCFEPKEFIADGNRVVVFGFYSGKGRMTQKPFATKWTMAFTIQGGKVTGFHEYFDTHNLGSAFN
jgi:ketosteroid isomerase-like protein